MFGGFWSGGRDLGDVYLVVGVYSRKLYQAELPPGV